MFWDIYSTILVFVFGLVFGSFYNVCIYRIPNGLSVVSPPSRCGSCNHTLQALDLIPVASWLVLGRKCRYCKAPISARYPLVELLTGAIFTGLYLKFGISWSLLFNLVFASLLILVTFIDIDHRYIPDRFVITGLILGLMRLFAPMVQGVALSALPWKDALIGGLLGGGSLLIVDMMGRLFYKKEGMGLGDVKLMVMAGIFMGFQNTAVALLFAVWIAAIGGVIILRYREEKSDHYMPFGPFLAGACMLSVFFGTQIANWYISLLFKV